MGGEQAVNENEQVQAVTESLDSAAQMAGQVATAIDGHHAAMMNSVAQLRGQWEGTARGAFEGVVSAISESILGLTETIRGVDDAVTVSSMGYLTANDDVSSAMTAIDVPFAGRMTATPDVRS
jgi:WXG100 family type VII secretion target